LLGLSTMYAETMVIPSITDFNHEFNATYNTSSLILTCYLISGTVMTPIAGKLADAYGRKKIMLIIMIIYSIGTIIGFLSSHISMLIIARLIQGVGIAMFPIAYGIIRDVIPEKKLSVGQGIFSSAFYAGSVIGLPIGAFIIEHFGWRVTFLSIIPITVILIILMYKAIPPDSKKVSSNIVSVINNEPVSHKPHIKKSNVHKIGNIIDLPGAVILSISIISLIMIFATLSPKVIDGDNNKNANFISIALLTLLLSGSLLSFILIEKRSKNPLIDISLLKNKTLLYSNFLIIIVGLSTFLIDHSIPILVRSPDPVGFGESAMTVASVLLPFSLLILVTSFCAGFLIAKIGNKIPTITGSVILTIGFVFLLMNLESLSQITISLCIIAIGLALLEEGIFNIVILNSTKKDTSAVMSITILLFLLSMSIGPVLSGYLLESNKVTINEGGVAGHYPSSASYILVFSVGFIVAVITIILSFILMLLAKENVKQGMYGKMMD
ncbi:MAG TPA: MFS transporter, partial [Phototrophicaceae bacterium]|nr:MFS transporter [Phototrophicaceae bacterium]